MNTSTHAHLGRMNDPTASAYIKGPCGDEMEFYLYISNDIIEDVKFYTDGCDTTRSCGEAAAKLVHGMTVKDALGISPKAVIDTLGDIPEEHRHCSILAVSTLLRALAGYLLKP